MSHEQANEVKKSQTFHEKKLMLKSPLAIQWRLLRDLFMIIKETKESYHYKEIRAQKEQKEGAKMKNSL